MLKLFTGVKRKEPMSWKEVTKQPKVQTNARPSSKKTKDNKVVSKLEGCKGELVGALVGKATTSNEV